VESGLKRYEITGQYSEFYVLMNDTAPSNLFEYYLSTEQDITADPQGPPDGTADLPPQKGCTIEPDEAAADENKQEGNDEPMEGAGEGKEGEDKEGESKEDVGGGDAPRSGQGQPQKRKWGKRDGR